MGNHTYLTKIDDFILFYFILPKYLMEVKN